MTVLDLSAAGRLFWGGEEAAELYLGGARVWKSPDSFGAADFAEGADRAFWFDGSNPMFQDAAGTVPSGLGDPVGYLGDGYGGALTQASPAGRPTRGADGLSLSGASAVFLAGAATWEAPKPGVYMAVAASITDHGGQAGIRGLAALRLNSTRYLDLGARYSSASVRQLGAGVRDAGALTTLIGGVGAAGLPDLGVPFVIEVFLDEDGVTYVDPWGGRTVAARGFTPVSGAFVQVGGLEVAPNVIHGAAIYQGAGLTELLRQKTRRRLEAICEIPQFEYGPELLVAPDDPASWSPSSGASLGSVGGWIRGECASIPAFAAQAVTTEIGARYALTADIRTNTGAARWIVGTTLSGSNLLALPGNIPALGQTFVATTTTTHVTARTLIGMAAGDYFEFRAASLRKLNFAS